METFFMWCKWIGILLFGFIVLFINGCFSFKYLYILFYLYVLSVKDIKTYFISKKMIVPSFVLLLFFFPYSIENGISSIVFGIPSLYMCIYKKWIGTVDVYFIFLFGFLLGLERMIVCMFFSIGVGFIYLFIYRKAYIPFIFCLSTGFIVAILKGYSLYYTLIY